MNVFILKAFWPELFLCFSIIVVLFFHFFLTIKFKFNFFVLENEIFIQIYIVLFYSFLLLLNNQFLVFESSFFFLNDVTSRQAQIFVLGFFVGIYPMMIMYNDIFTHYYVLLIWLVFVVIISISG
jgi:hypothetical protein